MPRLDGFELTFRIRSDLKLQGLPIILLTSLDSNEDKARSIEVAADAYMVKKEYKKEKILDIIWELLQENHSSAYKVVSS